jgi:hypothetical protein
VRPHHAPGGGNVARTLYDILKEIKRAEAAAAGTYAGNPAAQAAAAQAQGHDPLRAYLYRQQQDAAAETSRALARMGQAQLGRQFWASAAGQAQAAAGAREQSAVSLASLQQRVTGERARLDYGATPQGLAEVRQRAGLDRELSRLQKESAEAAARLRPFSERVSDTGREFFRITGVVSAAAFGLAKLGELASPSAYQTLQGSLELLAETVGELVVPVMYKLADSAQRWDNWLRAHSGGGTSREEGEGWGDYLSRRFVGEVTAFGTDFARAGLEPSNAWTALLPGGQAAFAAHAAAGGRLAAWTGWGGDDFQKSFFGQDRPAMQSFVPPGGGPIARYQTGEQYGEALNIAGLEVGASDPKTELLKRQIKELETHGGLLQDISKNQEATNRYLQSLQAWR